MVGPSSAIEASARALLFAAVVREATEEGLGIKVAGENLDHVAYADGLVVFAEGRPELEARLAVLSERLRRCGLLLNPAKSRDVVTIRRGSSLVGSPCAIQLGGSSIPLLGPTDTCRYLGVDVGWSGLVPFRTQGAGRAWGRQPHAGPPQASTAPQRSP